MLRMASTQNLPSETQDSLTDDVLWTQLAELYAAFADHCYEQRYMNASLDAPDHGATGSPDEAALLDALCELLTKFEPETGALFSVIGEDNVPSVSADSVSPQRRERVEWYFDEDLEEVAVEYPVPRSDLLSTLTKVQQYAETSTAFDALETVHILYESETERIAWLPNGSWAAVGAVVGASPAELRACREVHRRTLRTVEQETHLVDGEPIALLQ